MDTSVDEQQVQVAVRTGGQLPDGPRAPRVKLGEELPIFCERCGYSLHGLPQSRCGQCTILQFHCPECGHHQPINTLRPAVQSALGRVRAWTLGLLVFFRIMFFFWLLFAWGAVGLEFAYQWNYRPQAGGGFQQDQRLGELEPEFIAGVVIFGLSFGLVSRMFLLRWRRGIMIGLVLGGLVAIAMCIGAWLEYATSRNERPWPITEDFLLAAAISAIAVVVGSTVSWPIWAGLVKVFLPKRAGEALLAWQSAMSAGTAQPRESDRAASDLSREAIVNGGSPAPAGLAAAPAATPPSSA